jgi:hypothetical protein
VDRVYRFFDRLLIVFVGLLGVAVLFFIARRDVYLTSPQRFIVLVLGPLAVGGGLLTTFALSARARANIVLVLYFSLVTLYAVEVFLFLDPFYLVRPRIPPDFDDRGPLEVVRDLRGSGEDVYPVLPSETWFDSPLQVQGRGVVPLSGMPRTTLVMCNESGTYVTHATDRFGFNNPDSLWDREVDVVLVGDSFVEGWCVPGQDSFAALVRDQHPDTLNLGYTGHGPLTELGTVREYLVAREPEHVFWFFYEDNDLAPNLSRELQSGILRRYLENDFKQRLAENPAAIAGAMRPAIDAKMSRALHNLMEQRGFVRGMTSIAKLTTIRMLLGIQIRDWDGTSPQSEMVLPDSELLSYFERILAEAKRIVEEWGGALHLVYLPDLASAIGREEPDFHGDVVAVGRDLGVPTIDMLLEFRSHPDPISLFPYEKGAHLIDTVGLHYDRDGHELVARRVLEAIPSSTTSEGH